MRPFRIVDFTHVTLASATPLYYKIKWTPLHRQQRNYNDDDPYADVTTSTENPPVDQVRGSMPHVYI